jgi:Mn2+/Fe2+ NRAMP family transporter
MSDMANEQRTNVMAYVVTLVIIGLNALLLFRILGGEF